MSEKNLQNELEDLRTLQQEILQRLSPNEKDVWDKFSIISAFISGVFLVAVGGYFTLVYQDRDDKRASATELHRRQLLEVNAVADLMPYILDEDEQTRKAAVLTLNTLSNVTLVTSLAEMFPSRGAAEALKEIAGSPTSTAEERELARGALRRVSERTVSALTDAERAMVGQSLYGGLDGLLSSKQLIIRQGYVASYDPQRRVPEWVAYHVKPSYLAVPPREGRFATFRADPDVANPVTSADYVGLFRDRGFARGHIAPYSLMGGDRNENGLLAEDGDEFDVRTIFEANLMSNVAPQRHRGFNSSPGIWAELEKRIESQVREKEREIWIFSGCVFGQADYERVGKNSDIVVPPMFWKIVAWEQDGRPLILAFLLPHHRAPHSAPLEDYLVSVDVLEALTGLDFFTDFEDVVEESLEAEDSRLRWSDF